MSKKVPPGMEYVGGGSYARRGIPPPESHEKEARKTTTADFPVQFPITTLASFEEGRCLEHYG